MPDVVTLRLRIGYWVDLAEDRDLRALADADLFPSFERAEDLISGTLGSLRESSLEPWQHEFTASAYYANASAEGWSLLVDVAPFLDAVLDIETARTVAGAFLGALFGRLLRKPDWMKEPEPMTAEEVSQRVVDYMVRRDDLAPSSVQETAILQTDGGWFEVTVTRTTDGHRFLFRTDPHGLIVARVDLDELVAYSKRQTILGPPEAADDR